MSQIYAQQTVQNDRLCSLLSATLLRRILPRFSSAILQKASHRKYLPDISNTDLPFIMYVLPKDEPSQGNGACFGRILRQICREHFLHLVEVVLGDFPINDISYFCTKYSGQPMVILSCASNVDSVYRYIARCMDHGDQQLGSLLGLIFIAPTIFTSVVPFLPIPLLVITSPAPENDVHRRHALVDPNVIVLVNDEIGELDISKFSESIALWVARTVAKGANAICVLSNGRRASKTIKSRL